MFLQLRLPPYFPGNDSNSDKNLIDMGLDLLLHFAWLRQIYNYAAAVPGYLAARFEYTLPDNFAHGYFAMAKTYTYY